MARGDGTNRGTLRACATSDEVHAWRSGAAHSAHAETAGAALRQLFRGGCTCNQTVQASEEQAQQEAVGAAAGREEARYHRRVGGRRRRYAHRRKLHRVAAGCCYVPV